VGSSITISVLFTDVVDSTARSQRLGPEATEAERKAHFEVLRSTLAAHNGTEVKNLGDGLMVAFPSLSDAVGCGVGMQQAVEAAGRAHDDPLRIKVGISTGDADEEDADYFGPPVVEAARLCGIAEGGQVLTTDLARLLLGSRGGHRFSSLGDRELKGIEMPVAVSEVRWEPATGASAQVPLPDRLARESVLAHVGRHEPKEVLAQAWKAAAAGDQRLVLLSGEAGMGKTRLSTELARELHGQGATVLYGRCDEDLGLAYQPWVQALGHLVAHLDPEVVQRVVDQHGTALARIVPQMGAGPAGGDGAGERFTLMTSACSLLAAASVEQPILLVLDDLHWVDQASLQLLRHLITTDSGGSLLVVGTYRDTDLSAEDPLTALLADLHREEGVERVALTGLGDTDLVELLEAVTGHDMDEIGVGLGHALLRETAGNPFFVIEILRHLAETGAVAQGEDGRWALQGDLADLGLPQSVREVVGRRINRLGSEAHQLLSSAAVIGRDFDVELLLAVTGASEDDALDLLDEAAEAGVVEELASGRYSFTHALIEHTLYHDLSATRRRRAHERVAGALEELCGDDPGDRLGELAFHWTEASRPTQLVKAIDYSTRAGWRALEQYAPDDAAGWFTRALDLDDGADPATSIDLMIGLGAAQRDALDPAARITLAEAARRARELGDVDRFARAVLAVHRGVAGVYAVYEEMRQDLQAALELLPPEDSIERAVLLAIDASHRFIDDLDGARLLAARAQEMAERLGDDATSLEIETMLATLVDEVGSGDDFMGRYPAILDLATRVGNLSAEAALCTWRADAAIRVGDRAAADEAVTRLAEIADRTGQPLARYCSLQQSSRHALLDGRIAESEVLCEEALAAGGEESEVLAAWGAQQLAIRRVQGRLAEILPVFVDAAAGLPDLVILQVGTVQNQAYAGQLEDAAAAVERLASTGFTVPRDQLWLVTTTLYADAVTYVGRTDLVPALYDQLAPYGDRMATAQVVVDGPVARVLGRMDALLGRREDAGRWFQASIDLADRLRAPYWAARSRGEWGSALVDSATEVDLAQARDLLDEALRVSEERGFVDVAERSRAALARFVA
jgi:class 3 adenylate cyclase